MSWTKVLIKKCTICMFSSYIHTKHNISPYWTKCLLNIKWHHFQVNIMMETQQSGTLADMGQPTWWLCPWPRRAWPAWRGWSMPREGHHVRLLTERMLSPRFSWMSQSTCSPLKEAVTILNTVLEDPVGAHLARPHAPYSPPLIIC